MRNSYINHHAKTPSPRNAKMKVWSILTVLMAILGMAFDANAQITLDRVGLSASSPSTVAYSLRRLSNSYSGNLIQVRRSSDDATTDIGFDGSGNLDVAALSSFVGGDDGFVSIWYDQSGNANDAVQASNALQPMIVDNGTVLTKNSKPAVRFDGTTYIGAGSTPYGITSARTVNLPYNLQSGTPSHILDRDNAGTPIFSVLGDGTGQIRNDASTLLGSVGNAQTAVYSNVFTMTWDGSDNVNIYKNGTNDYSGTLALPSTMEIMRIGRHLLNTSSSEINIWEVILFPSSISSGERLALECNQINNFSFATVSGSQAVCVGSSTTLSSLIGGGAWTSSNTGLATVNASTGAYTGIAAGNPNITYTMSTGCTIVTAVTVNARPTLTATVSPLTACVGGTLTLTSTPLSGSGVYTAFTWSGPSGFTATTQNTSRTSITTGHSGVYSVTVTDDRSCTSTTAVTLETTVNVVPTITATVTPTSSCAGTTLTLNSTPASGSGVYSSYSWVGPNGFTATVQNPNRLTTGSADGGVYSVTVTDDKGCASATGTAASITIFNNPSMTATVTPTALCEGGTVNLTSTPSGGTGVYVSYSWTGPSTFTATDQNTSRSSVLPTHNGVYSVTVTDNNGCVSAPALTATLTVNVNPILTIPSPICATSLFTFGATPSAGVWSSTNPTAITITPGTGAVTSSAAGSTVIQNTSYAGCITTVNVTVTPAINANTGDTYLCIGQPGSAVILSNASIGGTWVSSDIATILVSPSNGAMRGLQTGNATISYKYSNACYSATLMTVNAAVASITGTANVCPGTSVTLGNVTPSGTWSSSNLTNATVNSASGAVTGLAAGTATISYIVNAGCFKTTTQFINALPGNIGGTAAICNGSSTTLSCSPSGGTWTSSAVGVATINASTGAVTSIGVGNSNITYEATTGCTRVKVLTVNALPTAITGTASVCIGSTTTLNTTPGGGAWTSSNTGRASVNAATGVVTGITAGTCNITYTLSGCTVFQQVTVNALPTAITGPSTVCVNGTAAQVSTPSGGVWTSSDPGIASINSSTGLVTAGAGAGNTTIEYTLATGCSRSREITVNVSPADITGTFNVCVNSTRTYSSSGGGTWSSSNTVKATINSVTGVLTGLSSGTTTISYIVSAGCYKTATVTINALPAAITGTNTYCVGNNVALSTGTVGGTWSTSNAAITTINATSGVAYGVAGGNANISYTLGTGCAVGFPVTVNALPTAITGTASICVGATSTLNSTPAGAWTSSNVLVATIDASTGEVYGVDDGTATITYTVATGCFITKVVTVNPIPTTITGTASVCDGSTSTLSSTPTGGVWSSGTPAFGTINAATGVVTGIDPGQTTITYTTAAGCSITRIVTVNALPGAITGTASVCEGLTTTLNATPGGGVWSSSNISLATVGTAGEVSGIGGGTLTISYQLATGCYSTVAFTVNALPSAITGSASVCIGSTTALSSSPGGGVWSSSAPATASVNASTGVVTGILAGNTDIQYQLATGCIQTVNVTVFSAAGAITGTLDVCAGSNTTLSATGGGTWSSTNLTKATVNSGTGVVTGISAGTARISYIISAGCFSTAVVTVNALPAAITGPTSVCEGSIIAQANATVGGTWSSSDLTNATIGSASGLVTGVDDGTSTITYTTTAGCISTREITVNVTPTAITGTMTVCATSTTTLNSTPGGGAWTSSNTGVATVNSSTGVVTAIAAGTSLLSYTAGGCLRTATVTVNPLPGTLTGTASVCEGANTTLTSTPGGGTWSSSAPLVATISATGTVTGIGDGNAIITYEISTGCIRTREVTVNAAPTAITGTAAVCIGSTTTLNSTPGGGVWTSSLPARGSIDASTGVVTGLTAGTTNITYTVSGCSAYATVTVNALPTVPTGTLTVCENNVVTLTSTPTGGAWSSLDAGVATVNAASGVVTGISAGNATIVYTDLNGCTRSAVVTVNTEVTANIGTAVICTGQPVANIVLTNATPGGTWSSSDVTKVTINPTTGAMVGEATGNANITYKLSVGCYAVTVATVNTAVAAITGTGNICIGATTDLNNATPSGTWSSSNLAKATVNSASGIVAGIAAGTATITYKVSDGCYKTTTQTVLTSPGAVTGTASVCVGRTTTLAGSPAGGTWASSVPTTASVNATTGVVTGLVDGNAIITYEISSGCTSTREVTVNALPAAITGTASVCIGSTTTLSASGGDTWSSSNAARATVDAAGEVTGIGAGTVTITYTIDATGCYTTRTVTVNALPTAIAGTPSACEGLTTALSSTPSGGVWSSGTPATATINSATGLLTGILAGSTVVEYQLATGCVQTVNVTVYANPANITGTLNVCVGSNTTLSSSGGGVWSSSNTVKATVNSATGAVSGLQSGTSVITYAVSAGCYKTAIVTVHALPATITGPDEVCEGSSIAQATLTTGGTWSSSDLTNATIGSTNGVVAGVDDGTSTITYTTAAGCIGTREITVNVTPGAITGTASVCVGNTTTLNSTPGGGAWASSNTGVATVNAATGVVTGIAAGTSVLTYTAGGCFRTTTVTVNPLPSTLAGTASVCEGANTTLTSTPLGGTWSSSAPLIATVSAGGIVTGIGDGNAIITYEINTGCIRTREVTVNAAPTAITGTAAVCIGSTTTLNSTPGGGVWTSSLPARGSIDASTGVVTGLTAGTTNITYTVSGCSAYATVTVNALPTVPTGTLTVCENNVVTLTSTPTGGAWSSLDAGVATVNAASGVVTGISAGNATIVYTDLNGCTRSAVVTVNTEVTANIGTAVICTGQPVANIVLTNATPGGTWSSSDVTKVTINPTTGAMVGEATGNANITYKLSVGCYAVTVATVNTAVAAITGTGNICIGATTDLNNATPSGTWSSSNLAKATVNSASGIVAGIAAGTATITYKVSDGCYKTTTQTVLTSPGAVTGTASVCVGRTTTLAGSPAGGTWASSVPTTASVNATTGVVTGLVDGNAIITYEISSGCTSTREVTVNALPAAITGTASVCIGSTTTLSASGGDTWSSSNAARATVDAAGEVTGIGAGTVTITYTIDATGCYTTRTVTVNALPTAIAGTPSACEGLTTALSSTPSGGVWSSGTPATATINSATGLLTGILAGSTVVEYQLATGCVQTVNVTVYANPANITGTLNVCVGSNTTLSSSGGGVWSSSNTVKATVNSATGAVSGLQSGTSVITYAVSAGCYKTAIVTVHALPATITGPDEVCEGSSIAQATLTTGGTWSSSDLTNATIGSTNGVVAGVDDGTSTITYTTAAGCIGTREITVNVAPTAITGTASVCIGSTTTLNSTPGGGVWSSSVPARATVNASTGEVTGIAAGTSVVSYTSGGCFKTKIVTVNALPAAITGTASVCDGANTTLVSSPGGGTWSSSNASLASVTATGVVTGVNPGNATITYEISTGCVRTREVTVNIAPTAVIGAAFVCIGSTTTLNSTPGGGVWTSSLPAKGTIDASTGALTGVAAGTTLISYTVAGCRATKQVTINSLPSVITGTLLACVGNNMTLNATPTGGAWSSNNLTEATVNASTGAVTALQTGNATIVYTAPNTCTRSAIVTVNAAVTANTGLALLCTGQPSAVVLLTNPTGGGTWSTSNAARITISSTTGSMRALSTGVANITYKVSAGCYAVTEVTVNGPVAAITGTANICVGATTTLANITPSGTWSSSNLTKATVNSASGVVEGIASGTATITYNVSAGCFKTITQTVLTSPGTITGASTVIDGATTSLSCSPAGGTWSSLTPSLATVVPSTGLVTGVDPGAATIKYQLSNGCNSTHAITVTASKNGIQVSPIAEDVVISIFPNPTSGNLTIESPVTGTFTVYTIDGKVAEQFNINGTSNNITLPKNLVAGIYMCRFMGVDGSSVIVRLVYQP